MSTVQMIPISQIRVLNARVRNKAKFREIVANISKLGLKKPITVSRRGDGEDGYDLVCGQGRLEAFQRLGQLEVPAVVIDVPIEDRYIMSLVENLARRNHRTIEMARELLKLKERGYTIVQIAEKVDLSTKYVSDLLNLVENGENRLVHAVERHEIPISVATQIATLDDDALQHSLAEAYQSGELRGRAFMKARRLVELRRAHGKSVRGPRGVRKPQPANVDDLLRTYRRETQRQQLLVKKASVCDRQLRFIKSALKDLFSDSDFVSILGSEHLDELPKQLADVMRR
jgi:ParB family chromosome partitioning protein